MTSIGRFYLHGHFWTSSADVFLSYGLYHSKPYKIPGLSKEGQTLCISPLPGYVPVFRNKFSIMAANLAGVHDKLELSDFLA